VFGSVVRGTVDEAVNGPCLEALRRSKNTTMQIPKIPLMKGYLRFFSTKQRELNDVEMDQSTI